MSINCKHWQQCDRAAMGCCSIAKPNADATKGEAIDRPSHGYCINHCKARDPIRPDAPAAMEQPAPAATAESWWARKAREVGGNIFGPMLWKRLHQWAPNADLSEVDRWLHNFSLLLPCGNCRAHFNQLRQKQPPPKTSNLELCKWVWHIHNQVNREKENPSPEITWDKCCEIWRYPDEWVGH